MAVNTMARPAASAASITSSSRIEPPGWITAVAPASAIDHERVGEGEEGVRRRHRAFASGSADSPCALAASPAFHAAMRAASTRDI